jgi:hypothetical protein
MTALDDSLKNLISEAGFDIVEYDLCKPQTRRYVGCVVISQEYNLIKQHLVAARESFTLSGAPVDAKFNLQISQSEKSGGGVEQTILFKTNF